MATPATPGSDLNELVIFGRVAELGSFTAAAEKLGVPKSTVSRKVSALETRLGARLLERTTRALNLTDVGRVVAEHATRVLAEVEGATLAVSQMRTAPCGLLRVTAPLNFAFLGPIVADFLRAFPAVQVDLVCTDRLVDLVEEGFEVGIRAGRLTDSTLVHRQLGTIPSFLVASPAYLERRGRPKTPEELEQHDAMLFGVGQGRRGFVLQLAKPGVAPRADGEGRTKNVPAEGRSEKRAGAAPKVVQVPARFIVNDADMLYEAALSGLGIALLPVFRCAEDIRAQRLERVLADQAGFDVPFHAVYPSARHLSPKVRAFIDHLDRHMRPPPWEKDTAL